MNEIINMYGSQKNLFHMQFENFFSMHIALTTFRFPRRAKFSEILAALLSSYADLCSSCIIQNIDNM